MSIGKKFICALATMLMLCFFNISFASETNKRILFISSYSYDWPSVIKQLDGLNSVLDGEAMLETVYMNTKRLNTEEAEFATTWLIEKYLQQRGKYDAIIVGDDAALDYAQLHYDDFFKDTPVIFFGINTFSRAEAAEKSDNFSGIVEGFPIEETIAAAKQICPNATNVVALADSSESGQGSLRQFYDIRGAFPEMNFSYINASALTNAQLLDEIAQCDDSTILVYLMRSNDAEGNVYSMLESVESISQAAKIPVFKPDDIGVGYGLLGGAVISSKDAAATAARMALDAISGNHTPYVSTMPYYYLFDKNVLDRFGISTDKLPKGYVLINDKPRFYEEHPAIVIAVGVVFLIGIMAIAFLSRSNIRKRKFAEELSVERNKLKIAIEQSRMTYFEYDLETNSLIFGDKAQRIHGLPRVVENVPQGFFDTGRIQPQFFDTFSGLLDAMCNGQESAVGELQLYSTVTRSYPWVRLRFTLIKNDDSSVMYAICTAMNITGEKQAQRRYEQTRTYRELLDKTVLSSAYIDLTQNSIISTDKNDDRSLSRFDQTSADAFFADCIKHIENVDKNPELTNMLSRAALIAAFAQGDTSREALYQAYGDGGSDRWIRASITLSRNPNTANIEAYFYLDDITDSVMQRLSVERAISPDIEFVTCLDLNTNVMTRAYIKSDCLFEIPEAGNYESVRDTFIEKYLAPSVIKPNTQYLMRSSIMQALALSSTFTFTEPLRVGDGEPTKHTFEISYLDKTETALVFIMHKADEK